MIIKYLLIFLSLGFEAAFALPLFSIEMMFSILERNDLRSSFLNLLVFTFFLAIFYHLGFSMTLWLWGFLLIAKYFLSNKLGSLPSRLLVLILFCAYIFYQAGLVANWTWLIQFAVFAFYLYKKNLKSYV